MGIESNRMAESNESNRMYSYCTSYVRHFDGRCLLCARRSCMLHVHVHVFSHHTHHHHHQRKRIGMPKKKKGILQYNNLLKSRYSITQAYSTVLYHQSYLYSKRTVYRSAIYNRQHFLY
jgi:hypothetical protein